MSALPLKADIDRYDRHVRLVPKALNRFAIVAAVARPERLAPSEEIVDHE